MVSRGKLNCTITKGKVVVGGKILISKTEVSDEKKYEAIYCCLQNAHTFRIVILHVCNYCENFCKFHKLRWKSTEIKYNEEVICRRSSAKKKLFARGPPANKNLFSRGPLPNEKLFAGGPLANTKLFAGALSILCSPEWSYAVLFSLSLYCMVLCGHVRSFKRLSCCITELFSSDLYGCLKSCMVLFGSLWSIRSCQVLYDSK